MVSGLYENGLKTSVVTSGVTSRNPWTAPGTGSWLRVRWPSTLIEKILGISFLICRCTSGHCGRDPCPVRVKVSYE